MTGTTCKFCFAAMTTETTRFCPASRSATRRARCKPADRKPTAEQLAALQAYAAQHGRCWKYDLRIDWLYAAGGPELQQVRNTLGPRWLHTFKLPDPAAPDISQEAADANDDVLSGDYHNHPDSHPSHRRITAECHVCGAMVTHDGYSSPHDFDWAPDHDGNWICPAHFSGTLVIRRGFDPGHGN